MEALPQGQRLLRCKLVSPVDSAAFGHQEKGHRLHWSFSERRVFKCRIIYWNWDDMYKYNYNIITDFLDIYQFPVSFLYIFIRFIDTQTRCCLSWPHSDSVRNFTEVWAVYQRLGNLNISPRRRMLIRWGRHGKTMDPRTWSTGWCFFPQHSEYSVWFQEQHSNSVSGDCFLCNTQVCCGYFGIRLLYIVIHCCSAQTLPPKERPDVIVAHGSERFTLMMRCET